MSTKNTITVRKVAERMGALGSLDMCALMVIAAAAYGDDATSALALRLVKEIAKVKTQRKSEEATVAALQRAAEAAAAAASAEPSAEAAPSVAESTPVPPELSGDSLELVVSLSGVVGKLISLRAERQLCGTSPLCGLPGVLFGGELCRLDDFVKFDEKFAKWLAERGLVHPWVRGAILSTVYRQTGLIGELSKKLAEMIQGLPADSPLLAECSTRAADCGDPLKILGFDDRFVGALRVCSRMEDPENWGMKAQTDRASHAHHSPAPARRAPAPAGRAPVPAAPAPASAHRAEVRCRSCNEVIHGDPRLHNPECARTGLLCRVCGLFVRFADLKEHNAKSHGK